LENLLKHINLSVKQNRASQKAIFEHYSSFLYNCARKYLRNHHDIEDALQIAWVSIFKNLSNYKHSEKFEAWIKIIVIREAWRVRAKYKQVESLTIQSDVIPYDMESELFAKMSCENILKKLEFIAHGPQTVFKMYVLDGYNHSEIASILNISPSTSRVHLTNARKAFKKMFVHSTTKAI